MLNLLTNNGVCPCCAFPSASSSKRRASSFTCTPGAADDWLGAGASAALTGDLRLDGGTVVDPHDGGLLHGVSILVDQGRIVAIEKEGELRSDPSVQRIDITGKFVVPGYNDMHSHVLELEDPGGALALMLAEGVTGFRQMSGSPQLLEARRNQRLPIGKAAPALLEMPGTILTPLNADSVDAVKAEIKLQKEQGADFLKVGFLAPVVFIAAMAEAKRVGIAILGHLQDGVDAGEAAKAGFKSIEHLGPGATVWTSCSSIEDELKSEAKPVRIKAPPKYLPFLRNLILWRLQTVLINPVAFVPPAYAVTLQRAFDTFSPAKCKAVAARFVAEDTWHVPTLVRLRTQELADSPEYDADPYLLYMPKAKVKKWRAVTRKFKKLPASMRATFLQAYSKQLELTGLLAKSGVRMLTGTDGGWLSGPGLTLKEEFAELEKAGFTPLQILQMTTLNAAEYMGRTEAMGTVEPGRNADLVLLDANPLEAVANLHQIAGVVRAGVYYSKADLDALRARVAAGRGYLN